MSANYSSRYRTEVLSEDRAASRIGMRYFNAALALAAVLCLLAIGARTATAAVTHARLHTAMQRYGHCRTGTPVVFGESAAEGNAILDAMRFGNGAMIQVYYGDQRQDPDGRHVQWTTRHGVSITLAGFSHVRQVAGILDRLRSEMACK